jgi:cobaltochelatase CobN
MLFSSFILPFHSVCLAETRTGVFLAIGDYNSRLAPDAVREIRIEYPELSRGIDFRIAGSQESAAVVPVAVKKGVGVVNIMDRRAIDLLKPAITDMIRSGIRIYAVSGAFSREDKEMGLIDDPMVNRYYHESGRENIRRMILFLLKRDCGIGPDILPPLSMPQAGIYLKSRKRIVNTFDEFMKEYKTRSGPWVGLPFYKTAIDTGDTGVLDALIDRLEADGQNVLPVFGYPSETAVERFMIDENGKSRVQVVVGLSLKVGLSPQRAQDRKSVV